MGIPPQTTIVFVGLPDQLSVGMDAFYLSAGPTLNGIRFVGDGAHTVHWSTAGAGSAASVDSASRQGVFFFSDTAAPQVIKCIWDAASEELQVSRHTASGVSDEEVQRVLHQWYETMPSYAQLEAAQRGQVPRIEELDDEGRARKDAVFDWPGLMAQVSRATVARVLPEYGAGTEADADGTTGLWAVDTMMPTVTDQQELARETSEAGGCTGPHDGEPVLRFAAIDLKKTWRPGAVGAQRTLDYLDKSWYLRQVLATVGGAAGEFVGELALAFGVFVVYGNVSGAAQWRRALTLALQCEEYATTDSADFACILETARAQLLAIPAEYFVEVLAGRTYLRGMFGKLRCDIFSAEPAEDRWFAGVHGDGQARVKRAVRGIERDVFGERFGLDLEGFEEFEYRDWM